MLDPPYSLVKEAHRAVRSISISSVVVGYSNSLAAKLLAAHRATGGVEVRACWEGWTFSWWIRRAAAGESAGA